MSAPKPTFRVGNNGLCIVTDNPLLPLVDDGLDGAKNVEHYGGFLIAESLHPEMARKFVEILNAAVDVAPSAEQPKEPTLEERNAAVRAEWEAMQETETKGVRMKGGKKFNCEWRWTDEVVWKNNEPSVRYGRGWVNEDGRRLIEYRIVELPAPKIVPWKKNEVPVGSVIRNKQTDVRFIITGADDNIVLIQGDELEAEQVHHDYTMDDGSPAGTEVRE